MRTVGWTVLLLSLDLIASAGVPKKCSAPPEYPHTVLDPEYSGAQTFVPGQKVHYNCAEDFSPHRGRRTVQCVDGEWTRLTLKCEKRSCGNAGELPNGQLHYEGNTYVGEKVYAVCDEGYTLRGLGYMICKASGWTGDFPTCEEGEATCSTPSVANSVGTSGTDSVIRVGDKLTFACSQGFQLDGAQQITCGPDGQWQPRPPKCLPLPEKSQLPTKEAGGCGVPVSFAKSNANLADKYITMTSFASGDKVHYVCDVGYIPAGGSSYRRCIKGKWTPLWLKCERKPCGSAGEIINGQFVYTGVEFGDKATAVCDEGYHLVGQGTRNCMSAGWDGRVPTCEAVECEEPTGVTNAKMMGHREPPFTYKSVIRYHCPVGSLMGQNQIWCTKDGTWSAPPPKCKVITCRAPNVPGAYWTGAHRRLYQYRDAITFECKPGYKMTGTRYSACGRNGEWDPAFPKCTRPTRGNHRRNY